MLFTSRLRMPDNARSGSGWSQMVLVNIGFRLVFGLFTLFFGLFTLFFGLFSLFFDLVSYFCSAIHNGLSKFQCFVFVEPIRTTFGII